MKHKGKYPFDLVGRENIYSRMDPPESVLLQKEYGVHTETH